MMIAESWAIPVEAELGSEFGRRNEFGEWFHLRWGEIRFAIDWGEEINLKVVLKLERSWGEREQFVVETDPYQTEWNRHCRVTREFFLHANPATLGRISNVWFSYILHFRGQVIQSKHDYLFAAGSDFENGAPWRRGVPREWTRANAYQVESVDAELLQRDADWHACHFESLRLVPKFTKGNPSHPFHPKRYIHDQIDRQIERMRKGGGGMPGIRVCVDCIDDTDFVNHLLFACDQGVRVQCVVDWRKMVLTNSRNYARLKRSRIELTGVVCSSRASTLEVATDMHTKFILFGDQDCIEGSFNIAFDRWGSNWESGMAFGSHGVCRLLENVFQSIRGGIHQTYGIDPYGSFNLLYTFGRHSIRNGRLYRPHQAILSEIHRARHSIRLCLFLIGEMQGEYQDSVIDALIGARRRGVDVRILLNGHMARQGDPGRACSLSEELARPLLPSVERLKRSGVCVDLAYGQVEQQVPYCPLHSKYCVVDNGIVLEGSFNWYNTSVYSHDLLVVVARDSVARHYLYEFEQIHRLFRFPDAPG
ncbi:MAG: phospholipase D family protein [Verrucomicrobia bacterium]|nr:phospholipase D family protein [Verrucomicrobiota bacterium]